MPLTQQEVDEILAKVNEEQVARRLSEVEARRQREEFLAEREQIIADLLAPDEQGRRPRVAPSPTPRQAGMAENFRLLYGNGLAIVLDRLVQDTGPRDPDVSIPRLNSIWRHAQIPEFQLQMVRDEGASYVVRPVGPLRGELPRILQVNTGAFHRWFIPSVGSQAQQAEARSRNKRKRRKEDAALVSENKRRSAWERLLDDED